MARQCDPVLEWRKQYARRCLRVDFEPFAGAIFHASVKSIFPELRIVRAALSPGFLFRDDYLIRDGDDSIGFVVAQSGQLTARHLGREVQLAPGDATMMLMSATGGIGWRESSVLFDMLISPAEWEARGARPEVGLMQRLWGKSEAMQLLRGYVRSLERIGLAASVDNHALIRKHMVDLAVVAATARCPIGESSASEVVAARRTAALDYIASHFFGSRTQPSQCGAEPTHLAALPTTATGDSRDVIRFARHRAAPKRGVHAAYRPAWGSNCRHRLAVWIFRRFLL